MNEWNISDELLSKFLEGTTTDIENEQIFRQLKDDHNLATNLASMAEATKLVDKDSFSQPDINKAEQQIVAKLYSVKDSGKELTVFQSLLHSRTLWTVASVAVVFLLVIAGFVVYRVSTANSSEKLIAKQEVKSMNSVSNDSQEKPKTTNEINQVFTDERVSPKMDVKTEQMHTNNASHEVYTTKVIENNYATTKSVNSMVVKHPNKSNYAVLCKNLDKSFRFEWDVDNVKSMQFKVLDMQGSTIVEITDITINNYLLKYKDIYPKKNLKWMLIVVYLDDTQDNCSGQIQIDYNL